MVYLKCQLWYFGHARSVIEQGRPCKTNRAGYLTDFPVPLEKLVIVHSSQELEYNTES